MQLHDFNDMNSFPCNLRSLTVCLSEVIFMEGFMRKVYQSLSSLEVLHLIGIVDLTALLHTKKFCRMTNYELLRWLVETPPRDVGQYRMINASRSTVCHYNDKRLRDRCVNINSVISLFLLCVRAVPEHTPESFRVTDKEAAKICGVAWSVCMCVRRPSTLQKRLNGSRCLDGRLSSHGPKEPCDALGVQIPTKEFKGHFWGDTIYPEWLTAMRPARHRYRGHLFSELSMGWVDPSAGSRFFSFWSDGLGRVHYSKSTKIWKRAMLMHLRHG